mmetsp:Transcript_6466/g.20949  ORF Transcript_6466/g.20949 Transcript_6466/m.20949 type:complete len:265 (-) Transcript_6466:1457-2251(-)
MQHSRKHKGRSDDEGLWRCSRVASAEAEQGGNDVRRPLRVEPGKGEEVATHRRGERVHKLPVVIPVGVTGGRLNRNQEQATGSLSAGCVVRLDGRTEHLDAVRPQFQPSKNVGSLTPGRVGTPSGRSTTTGGSSGRRWSRRGWEEQLLHKQKDNVRREGGAGQRRQGVCAHNALVRNIVQAAKAPSPRNGARMAGQLNVANLPGEDRRGGRRGNNSLVVARPAFSQARGGGCNVVKAERGTPNSVRAVVLQGDDWRVGTRQRGT